MLYLGYTALLFFTVTRLSLALYTGTAQLPLALWPMAFIKGLYFDLAALAYVAPAFLILSAFLPSALRQKPLYLWIRFVGLVGFVFVLSFLSVAEFVFWMEFQTRFNFIALDYLIYTNEVIRNIWESYPMVWISLGLISGSMILAYGLHRRWQTQPSTHHLLRRVGCVVAAILLPWLSARYVYIEQMYRQGNAYAEELSGNGLFSLAAAARHNELDYDHFYATISQEKANQILKDLGVEWTEDRHRREFDRWGDDRPNEPLPSFIRRRPKNVVLISVESLSAHYLGVYGSTEAMTPRLDRLAREGFWFSHVLATGTRTVRGLEALSLATPPIPGQSIIRRPKNSNLASIGGMLSKQNVQPYFLYGGYGYFDNMSHFFKANQYQVMDRTDIPDSNVVFENVWGVADETLLTHTLSVLDQAHAAHKTFFAHVMTTSNHRPYTYPQGRIDIPSPGGRRGAVKYTDFAIGQFIENARSRPWFKDTLFVIVADHCASVAGKTEVPVAQYRIPLILYGPAIVKPGREDRMISQIDIPPTLLDILGLAGDDNFFGKEVSEQTGAPRAFVSNYQVLGYYKNDHLVLLKPKRKIDTYRIDPLTDDAVPAPADPALVEEAIAYYQTASRAFKKGQLELLWK